ncbi:DsbA family protein [Neolewinella antarctica]|uniref:DSBA-like thioredoxin domain-containing protein n=1 Tax=Neolewinella antarctica TaxID=442734 RepID=A0ABX0X9X3_9BACT|nr:DsbA family protein [Neolewinella antarctica]NJC25592.1 putative protein-disulfide isomerase [Neolewinella antarctica]
MTKLYYCYDALCGWCYGFSSVMTTFYAKHRTEIGLEVISGGMITGDRIGPIGEVAGYIKTAYKDVENRCQVTFGESFLDGTLAEGSAIFTSVPPAVALSIVKDKYPENALDYAAVLQKAIYYDGIQPTDIDAYGLRAEKYGFDRDEFVRDMQSERYQLLAQDDFSKSNSFGVTGFPTLIAEAGDGKRYAIARGYTDLAQLEKTWEAILGLN